MLSRALTAEHSELKLLENQLNKNGTYQKLLSHNIRKSSEQLDSVEAVDHGMGSRERAEDFPSYITEVLYMNESLDSDDVAAEIEEYMDEAFQTELQDDSAIDVAKELLRFYKYCLAGEESTAVTELAKLPPLQIWITGKKPGSDSQGQDRQQVVTTEPNNSIENIEKMEEDDGWTEVKTRRQK